MLAIFKKYKVPVAILGLIAAGLIFFTLFPIGDVPTDSLLITSTDADTDRRMREELLILLSELRTLNLDNTIFSDARFRSLIDFSVELQLQPVGRRNPFLPIGADPGEITDDNVAAIATTTTTQAAPHVEENP